MCTRLDNQYILLISLKLAFALVDRTPAEIKFACEKACVVPDVLPVAPTRIVKVKYFHGFIANLGNKLITNDIHIIPNIMEWPAKNKTHYTVLLVGPDEPSAANAYNSQVIYWLKTNIYETSYNNTGDTIVKYASPEPAEGTSWHRYVFVVYEQPHGNMNVKMKRILHDGLLISERANFSTQAFAKDNNMGDAYAVNFFIFEWRDDFSEPLDFDADKDTPSPVILPWAETPKRGNRTAR